MITKHRVLMIAAAAAILLSILLRPAPARGNEDGQVVLAFTKWLRSGPQGRLDDPAGTFEWRLVSISPPEREPPTSPISQIEAEYTITVDGQKFTAAIQGHQNNRSHNGVLNGVITSGWRLGAQVHVEFEIVDQGLPPAPRNVCDARTCFVGTISIMPDSDND